jgi:hypothetical protein
VPAKSFAGIVVDDAKAKLTGEWARGSMGGIDEGYLHDQNDGKGEKSARFEATLPKAGLYEVRLAYTPNPNRATNVPVTVESVDGKKVVHVNQRTAPPVDKYFVSLGKYVFASDRPSVVTVTTERTDGYVIIDAVQWVPAN